MLLGWGAASGTPRCQARAVQPPLAPLCSAPCPGPGHPRVSPGWGAALAVLWLGASLRLSDLWVPSGTELWPCWLVHGPRC